MVFVQWAMSQFENTFRKPAEMINACLADASSMSAALVDLKAASDEDVGNLQLRLLRRPESFEDCVEWAYRRFEQEFSTNITKLLNGFPLDCVSVAAIWLCASN